MQKKWAHKLIKPYREKQKINLYYLIINALNM